MPKARRGEEEEEKTLPTVPLKKPEPKKQKAKITIIRRLSEEDVGRRKRVYEETVAIECADEYAAELFREAMESDVVVRMANIGKTLDDTNADRDLAADMLVSERYVDPDKLMLAERQLSEGARAVEGLSHETASPESGFSAMQKLSEAMGLIVEIVKFVLPTGLTGVFANISYYYDTIANWATRVVYNAGCLLKKMLSYVSWFASKLAQGFVWLLKQILSAVEKSVAFVRRVAVATKDLVASFVGSVTDSMIKFCEGGSYLVPELVATIRSMFSSCMTLLLVALRLGEMLFGPVLNAFRSMFERKGSIMQLIVSFFGYAKTMAEWISTHMPSFVPEWMNKMYDGFSWLGTTIGESSLGRITTFVFEKIQTWMEKCGPTVSYVLEKIADAMKNYVLEPLSTIFDPVYTTKLRSEEAAKSVSEILKDPIFKTKESLAKERGELETAASEYDAALRTFFSEQSTVFGVREGLTFKQFFAETGLVADYLTSLTFSHLPFDESFRRAELEHVTKTGLEAAALKAVHIDHTSAEAITALVKNIVEILERVVTKLNADKKEEEMVGTWKDWAPGTNFVLVIIGIFASTLYTYSLAYCGKQAIDGILTTRYAYVERGSAEAGPEGEAIREETERKTRNVMIAWLRAKLFGEKKTDDGKSFRDAWITHMKGKDHLKTLEDDLDIGEGNTVDWNEDALKAADDMIALRDTGVPIPTAGSPLTDKQQQYNKSSENFARLSRSSRTTENARKYRDKYIDAKPLYDSVQKMNAEIDQKKADMDARVDQAMQSKKSQESVLHDMNAARESGRGFVGTLLSENERELDNVTKSFMEYAYPTFQYGAGFLVDVQNLIERLKLVKNDILEFSNLINDTSAGQTFEWLHAAGIAPAFLAIDPFLMRAKTFYPSLGAAAETSYANIWEGLASHALIDIAMVVTQFIGIAYVVYKIAKLIKELGAKSSIASLWKIALTSVFALGVALSPYLVGMALMWMMRVCDPTWYPTGISTPVASILLTLLLIVINQVTGAPPPEELMKQLKEKAHKAKKALRASEMQRELLTLRRELEARIHEQEYELVKKQARIEMLETTLATVRGGHP